MRLVILDRDGVINEDSALYIKSAQEWRPIPGSLEAIARLCQAEVRVAVATNQAGLGRGLFDYDAFMAMNEKLTRMLAALGGRIEAVAYAPEHPDNATERRKPSPGMLHDLVRRLAPGVGLDGIPFVGDSISDIQAARAGGAKPVLVHTGNGLKTAATHAKALDGVPQYADLGAFATAWLAERAPAGAGWRF